MHRFYTRAHRALLLSALVLITAAGLLSACSTSVPAEPKGLQLIPAGEYEGVWPLEIPRQDIAPTSRFLFTLKRPAADHPSQTDAWYGYPTKDAVYLINGSKRTRKQFEQQLSDAPPVRLDIVVRTPGQMERLNGIVPQASE